MINVKTNFVYMACILLTTDGSDSPHSNGTAHQEDQRVPDLADELQGNEWGLCHLVQNQHK
jgi:hypothetical protein